MNPYKNVEKIQKSKSTSSKDASKEFVRSFSEAIAEGLKEKVEADRTSIILSMERQTKI